MKPGGTEPGNSHSLSTSAAGSSQSLLEQQVRCNSASRAGCHESRTFMVSSRLTNATATVASRSHPTFRGGAELQWEDQGGRPLNPVESPGIAEAFSWDSAADPPQFPRSSSAFRAASRVFRYRSRRGARACCLVPSDRVCTACFAEMVRT